MYKISCEGSPQERTLGQSEAAWECAELWRKILAVRSGNRRNRGRSQVEGRSTKGIPDFAILLIRDIMYNNKTLFLILK